MTDELHFRIPLISPYLTRANEHIRWNLKRALNADKALRDRVQGKVVLITGASSGIGARVAGELTDAGATVLLVARSQDKLEALATTLCERGGKAYALPGNIANMEDCDRVCEQALHDHGRVDILINNAGRSIRRSIKFSFERFHDFERTMQLNYFGAIRMAMNLLPSMLERNEGHIINVSTVGVQANPARFSAYLGSKWALEGWTWAAANEFAHTGVRFSTLNYPLVRTPMIAPTRIYDYTPAMSPQKAVEWMLDIVTTQNKRKVTPTGLFALSMYYLLPKTAESVVNLGYQTVYEQPPENYQSHHTKSQNSEENQEEPSEPAAANYAPHPQTSTHKKTGRTGRNSLQKPTNNITLFRKHSQKKAAPNRENPNRKHEHFPVKWSLNQR
ncbi:predicted short chain dehydrogenase [gamma proteobacterium HdN1]|nr:predicted short chain dehydrogenase [gamma proteobacterium HdN1]